MHLPRFLRRVNRAVTNPLMRTFAWWVPPLAVVHHVGRTSGRRYRTPVLAFPSVRGLVIPMTYGAMSTGRAISSPRTAARSSRAAGASPCAIRGSSPSVPPRRACPRPLRPVFRAMDLPGYVLLDRRGDARKRAGGKA